MYNKLFGKILDSSIWLAPDPHRLVWITFLAAMDEDGHVMFASAGNVAARARVTREQAEAAIAAFEAPDPDSGDPENEGRRIERFPGGWLVLNAAKYRALVTREIIRAQSRQRMANKRARDAGVTQTLRKSDESVTPSDTDTDTDTEKRKEDRSPAPSAQATPQPLLLLNHDTENRIPPRMLVALDPQFALPSGWGENAEALGWSVADILRESEKFRQYWVSGNGSGKRRSVKGWRQAWANWLSKAERFKR